MLRIVVEITGGDDDPLGVKERLAMELEKYGSHVRVVEVRLLPEEQIKLEG